MPILGRPVFLGQLYNATTGNFLNWDMFDGEAVSRIGSRVGGNQVLFKRGDQTKEKFDHLNLSATVAADLLSGALQVKGGADYLTDNGSQYESIAIQFSAAVGRDSTYLVVNELLDAGKVSTSIVRTIGATHVVTGINGKREYRASLQLLRTESSKISELVGSLEAKLKACFEELASAQGNLQIQDKHREILKSYALDISLLGDFYQSDWTPPFTLVNFIDTLTHAESQLQLEGLGYSGHAILTPVGLFDSTIAGQYEELVDSDLNAILAFYDLLAALNRDVADLVSRIDLPLPITPLFSLTAADNDVPARSAAAISPSLLRLAQVQAQDTELLFTRARGEIAAFLRDFRTIVDKNAVAQSLLSRLKGRPDQPAGTAETYNSMYAKYRSVDDSLDWFRVLQDTTRQFGFPLLSTGELDRVLSSTFSSMRNLIVFVIPSNVGITELINLYNDFQSLYSDSLSSILSEGFSVPGLGENTRHTLYLDAGDFDAVKRLDGERGFLSAYVEQVQTALAQNTFMTPGLFRWSKASDGLLDWSDCFRDGWGWTRTTAPPGVYIGWIKDGLPHGPGRLRFDTASTAVEISQGYWFRGRLDGFDTTLRDGEVIEDGFYINGVRQGPDVAASLVDVYYLRNGTPIDKQTVAVPLLPPGTVVPAAGSDEARGIAFSRSIYGMINRQIPIFQRALGATYRKDSYHVLNTFATGSPSQRSLLTAIHAPVDLPGGSSPPGAASSSRVPWSRIRFVHQDPYGRKWTKAGVVDSSQTLDQLLPVPDPGATGSDLMNSISFFREDSSNWLCNWVYPNSWHGAGGAFSSTSFGGRWSGIEVTIEDLGPTLPTD